MNRFVGISLLVLAAGAGAAWYFSSRPVIEEDWEMDASAGAPAGASLSPEIQSLVDRIAGTESMDASKAWLELGARYRDARSYLVDVRPALWDTRPVAFGMVKERMSGGGATFIYYTVQTPSSKGVPAFVHTVGQALAYHLWQYEDVSNSGFKGTFKAWWSGYAASHGLPGLVGG